MCDTFQVEAMKIKSGQAVSNGSGEDDVDE